MNQQVDNAIGRYDESAAGSFDATHASTAVGGEQANNLQNASGVAAPAYTTEADIEAMAEAIFFSGKGEWSITPHHVNQKTREQAKSWWQNPPNQDMCDDKELAYLAAKAALAASPVHAELARVKAECERLRDVLENIANAYCHVPNTMVDGIKLVAKQALQQKGG